MITAATFVIISTYVISTLVAALITIWYKRTFTRAPWSLAYASAAYFTFCSWLLFMWAFSIIRGPLTRSEAIIFQPHFKWWLIITFTSVAVTYKFTRPQYFSDSMRHCLDRIESRCASMLMYASDPKTQKQEELLLMEEVEMLALITPEDQWDYVTDQFNRRINNKESLCPGADLFLQKCLAHFRKLMQDKRQQVA